MSDRIVASNQATRTRSYTTDFLGNVILTTNPDGTQESYAYNSFGNIVSVTKSNGDTMYYNYDLSGNLQSVTDYNGNTVEYFYDGNGNTTGVIQGLSAPVFSFSVYLETTKYLTYTYDILGRNTGISSTLTNQTHMTELAT